MLPQGETRFLNVSYGPNSRHNIYQIDGAGFNPQTPVPRSASTLTLMSNSTGPATLSAGFSTDGNLETAVMIPQPLLKLEVYGKKAVDLVVVPVAYKAANGVVTNPVKMATPQAAAAFATSLQSFVDTVFLQQANIKVNVLIAPVVPVEWDFGVGSVALNSGTLGLRDNKLQVLDTVLSYEDEKLTLEEDAIFDASPPATHPNTITLYYVRTDGFVFVEWADMDAEEAHLASTLKYRSIWGLAPRWKRRGGEVAWVMEHATVQSSSVLHTIAHEVGHKLGLKHSTANESASCHLINGDNENRLMTGRVGPKAMAGPTKLIHAKWFVMRRSNLLYNSNSTP
jgi:hypothetical protein